MQNVHVKIFIHVILFSLISSPMHGMEKMRNVAKNIRATAQQNPVATAFGLVAATAGVIGGYKVWFAQKPAQEQPITLSRTRTENPPLGGAGAPGASVADREQKRSAAAASAKTSAPATPASLTGPTGTLRSITGSKPGQQLSLQPNPELSGQVAGDGGDSPTGATHIPNLRPLTISSRTATLLLDPAPTRPEPGNVALAKASAGEEAEQAVNGAARAMSQSGPARNEVVAAGLDPSNNQQLAAALQRMGGGGDRVIRGGSLVEPEGDEEADRKDGAARANGQSNGSADSGPRDPNGHDVRIQALERLFVEMHQNLLQDAYYRKLEARHEKREQQDARLDGASHVTKKPESGIRLGQGLNLLRDPRRNENLFRLIGSVRNEVSDLREALNAVIAEQFLAAGLVGDHGKALEDINAFCQDLKALKHEKGYLLLALQGRILDLEKRLGVTDADGKRRAASASGIASLAAGSDQPPAEALAASPAPQPRSGGVSRQPSPKPTAASEQSQAAAPAADAGAADGNGHVVAAAPADQASQDSASPAEPCASAVPSIVPADTPVVPTPSNSPEHAAGDGSGGSQESA